MNTTFAMPAPGQVLLIEDDTTAKEAIVYFGVADVYDQQLIPPQPNTNCHSSLHETPTHWVFIAHHFGRPDGDNGYLAMFLPKTNHDREQFLNFVTASMQFCNVNWDTLQVREFPGIQN
jgi:hypothetical protein